MEVSPIMHLKKLFNILLLLIIIISLSITGCTKNTQLPQGEIAPTAKTTFLMGTLVKITIYDELKNDSVFDKAFNRIQEIEDKMTINKDSEISEIIRLNKTAGKDFTQLSPDTFYVLEKGKYYSELSEGQFDITIGPIVKLWNIDTENAYIPQATEIKSKLPLVNYKNLELDDHRKKAKLAESNMIVDLGAIAKGYAADEVAKILTSNGIKNAIINLGGNILTIGVKADGSPWRLGLQDPFEPRGNYMGIVKLANQALVSSGTYEKYFEQNGKRYHHIIDPQTGYPAENNLISVSIITKESIDADALSTSIFLLGLDKGMKIIEDLANTEAIFITYDKKVYVSRGITKEQFEITKSEFQLQE